jgi:hypothetical protein
MNCIPDIDIFGLQSGNLRAFIKFLPGALILGKPILIKEAETLLLYSMKISVTGIMI